MLDIKSVEGFVAIAIHKSFRIAASQLHMTQPALSVRLKRLEDQLGFLLFKRTKHSVEITLEGQNFLPHAESLLLQAARTREAANMILSGKDGTLRIGYTPVSFFGEVPHIINEYRKAHPNVVMAYSEMLSHEIETALAQKTLDVGFVHPPLSEKSLASLPMKPERLVIALPDSHELAKADSLPMNALRDENFIFVRREIGPVFFDQIIQLCARAGFSPHVEQYAETSIGVIGLVSSGIGVGFVIESMANSSRKGVRYVPIDGEVPELPFALAWNNFQQSALIDGMIKTVEIVRAS